MTPSGDSGAASEPRGAARAVGAEETALRGDLEQGGCRKDAGGGGDEDAEETPCRVVLLETVWTIPVGEREAMGEAGKDQRGGEPDSTEMWKGRVEGRGWKEPCGGANEDSERGLRGRSLETERSHLH